VSRPDGEGFVAIKLRPESGEAAPLPRVEIVLDWLEQLKGTSD
jgi:hypothetical protein